MKIQAQVIQSFATFKTRLGQGQFFVITYKDKKVHCVTYNSQLANAIKTGAIIEFDWWEPQNVKNRDNTWKTVMLISMGTVNFQNGIVVETPQTLDGEEKLQEINKSEELNFDWEKDLF